MDWKRRREINLVAVRLVDLCQRSQREECSQSSTPPILVWGQQCASVLVWGHVIPHFTSISWLVKLKPGIKKPYSLKEQYLQGYEKPRTLDFNKNHEGFLKTVSWEQYLKAPENTAGTQMPSQGKQIRLYLWAIQEGLKQFYFRAPGSAKGKQILSFEV